MAPSPTTLGLRGTAFPGREPLYPRGVVLAILGGLALSPSGLLIRTVETASDWQVVGYRSAFLALTILGVLAARHRTRLGDAFRAAGWPSLVGGVVLGASNCFYVLSIRHTSVANTLLLISTAPFFAAILGRLILAERVPAVTWAAIAAALCGVGVMVYGGLGHARLFGSLMALAAAVSFAVLTIILRRGRRVDMIPTIFIAGVGGALAGAFLAEDLSVSGHDLMILAVMGCLQVSLGFLLMILASRHLPAAQLPLFTLLEVILGPIWVWLALSEVPLAMTIFGGVMVLGALAGQALVGVRSATR